MSGHLRRALVVLWWAVATIMLIACVNLSNLLLARTTARAKEFAMRTALGATRWRLLAQLLAESLVLSAAGALLGIGFAYAVTTWLAQSSSIALPLLSRVHVDATTVMWTVLLAIVAALLFGTIPGLRLAAGNIHTSLSEATRGTTVGRQHERLRSTLVISEVALACVLLVGSGLLLRSFLRVLEVDLGFAPERAAAIRVAYEGTTPAERSASLQRAIERVRAIPGVTAAGFSDMLPLGRDRSWGLAAKGRAYANEDETICMIRVVTPGYLGAMGMRLRSGRDFTWLDGSTGHKAVIVNETGAKKHWGAVDVAGRTAMLSPTEEALVVGVVADVRQQTVESGVACEMFQPVAQADPEGAQIVVRSARPLDGLTMDVMRVLRELNPGQPAAALEPLQVVLDRSLSPRMFFVALVASFAAVGLLLASLGIYGVISYGVTRQRQEIGIRMALGASAADVRRGVLARSLRLVVPGLVLGAIVSLAVTRWMAALLFHTEPGDPMTFAAIVLMLGAVSIVAGYIPARRASSIDPMIALREE